jgi:hypothetical protein
MQSVDDVDDDDDDDDLYDKEAMEGDKPVEERSDAALRLGLQYKTGLLARFIELGAPFVIVRNEHRMIGDMLSEMERRNLKPERKRDQA